MQLGLHVCCFTLKKKYHEEYINLNKKITINNNEFEDIIDVIENFFDSFQSYQDDEYNSKIFKINYRSENKFDTEEYYGTWGYIKSGVYGIASDIINTENENVEFKKEINHADAKSFVFLIALPKTTNAIQKGIMVFQNIGSFGVKITTLKYLNEFIKSKMPKYFFETRSISPEEVFKQITNDGNILKIRFIKNKTNSDLSDNIIESGGKEERIVYKPTLQPRFLDSIRRAFKNNRSLVEIVDRNTQIKLTYNLYGSIRTIDFRQIESLSLVIVLPSEIKAIDGNPKINKLLEFIFNLLNSYKDKIVFTID